MKKKNLKFYYKMVFTYKQIFQSIYNDIHCYFFNGSVFIYVGRINYLYLKTLYEFLNEIQKEFCLEFSIQDKDLEDLKNFLKYLITEKNYLKANLELPKELKNGLFKDGYLILNKYFDINLALLNLVNYIFLHIFYYNHKLFFSEWIYDKLESFLYNNFFLNLINIIRFFKFNLKEIYKVEHELINVGKSLKFIFNFIKNLNLSDYLINSIYYNSELTILNFNVSSLNPPYNIKSLKTINIYQSKEFTPVKLNLEVNKINKYKRYFKNESLEKLNYLYFYNHNIINLLVCTEFNNIFVSFFKNVYKELKLKLSKEFFWFYTFIFEVFNNYGAFGFSQYLEGFNFNMFINNIFIDSLHEQLNLSEIININNYDECRHIFEYYQYVDINSYSYYNRIKMLNKKDYYELKILINNFFYKSVNHIKFIDHLIKYYFIHLDEIIYNFELNKNNYLIHYFLIGSKKKLLLNQINLKKYRNKFNLNSNSKINFDYIENYYNILLELFFNSIKQLFRGKSLLTKYYFNSYDLRLDNMYWNIRQKRGIIGNYDYSNYIKHDKFHKQFEDLLGFKITNETSNYIKHYMFHKQLEDLLGFKITNEIIKKKSK